jgi:hypothetical protein
MKPRSLVLHAYHTMLSSWHSQHASQNVTSDAMTMFRTIALFCTTDTVHQSSSVLSAFIGFTAALMLLTQALLAQQQWQASSGPYGGNIRHLSAGRDALFAGTSTNGVFRLERFSQTWRATQALPNPNVDALFASPGSSIIFAATNDGVIHTSFNNGDTWNVYGRLGLIGRATALAAFGTTVFVGTQSGVYRSTDNGQSFQLSIEGFPNADRFINALAVSNTNLLAASNSGLYLSTDAGVSWRLVMLPGLINGREGANDVVTSLWVNAPTVIVGTAKGAYISLNNGATFSKFNSSTTFVSRVALSSTTVVALTDIGVVRANATGGEWSVTSLERNRLQCVGAFAESFFAGGSLGIARSNDNGTQWSSATNGMIAHRILSLYGQGATVFAGTDVGIFRSTDRASTWSEAQGTPNTFINAFFRYSASRFTFPTLFAATNNGLYRLAGDANAASAMNARWERLATFPDRPVLTMTADSSFLYAGTELNGLLRSSDGGLTWSNVGDLGASSIRSLAVGGGRLYAATGNNVRMSLDNGATWTTVLTGSEFTPVSAVVTRGSIVYAARQQTAASTADAPGVFRSLDSGRSWQRMNTGLRSLEITALLAAGSILYAGTEDAGVFVSRDSAQTWQALNNGLQGLDVYSMSLTSGELAGTTTILLGTGSAGVFTLSGITSVAQPATSKLNGLLYPNPVDDILHLETTLQTVQSSTLVTVRLLTPAGTIVFSRQERLLGLQLHMAIDVSHLPTGMYFLEVLDGSRRLVERVIKH